MPYDPNTFKNLYPCPDRSKIRADIENQIKSGELQIPQEFLSDSKAFIDQMVEEEDKKERRSWLISQRETDQAWQKFMELDHGFEDLPEKVKSMIHKHVWERGHSGGYGEMNNLYYDVVWFTKAVFEAGKNEK